MKYVQILAKPPLQSKYTQFIIYPYVSQNTGNTLACHPREHVVIGMAEPNWVEPISWQQRPNQEICQNKSNFGCIYSLKKWLLIVTTLILDKLHKADSYLVNMAQRIRFQFMWVLSTSWKGKKKESTMGFYMIHIGVTSVHVMFKMLQLSYMVLSGAAYLFVVIWSQMTG